MDENNRKSNFWLSRRKKSLKSDLIKDTGLLHSKILNIRGKGILLPDGDGEVAVVAECGQWFSDFLDSMD